MLAWVFIFLTHMGSNVQHVMGECSGGGLQPFFLGFFLKIVTNCIWSVIVGCSCVVGLG